jgi:hypothetical protein
MALCHSVLVRCELNRGVASSGVITMDFNPLKLCHSVLARYKLNRGVASISVVAMDFNPLKPGVPKKRTVGSADIINHGICRMLRKVIIGHGIKFAVPMALHTITKNIQRVLTRC